MEISAGLARDKSLRREGLENMGGVSAQTDSDCLSLSLLLLADVLRFFSSQRALSAHC